MSGKNLLLKLSMVALLAAASVFAYEKLGLKKGTGIAGGATMIYQADPQVSDVRQACSILKKRVDPNGDKGISFTPLRGKRLQIRMPAASEESRKLKKLYVDAKLALLKINVTADDLNVITTGTKELKAKKLAEIEKKNPSQFKRVNELLAIAAEIEKTKAELRKFEDKIKSEDISKKTQDEIKKISAKQTDFQDELSDLDDRYSLKLAEIRLANADNHQINNIMGLFEKSFISPGINKRRKFQKEFHKQAELFVKGRIERIAKRDSMGKLVYDKNNKVIVTEIAKGAHLEYKKAFDEMVAAYRKWVGSSRSFEDPNDLKHLIENSGVLEFRITVVRGSANTDTTVTAAKAESLIAGLKKKGIVSKLGDKYVWALVEEDSQESFENNDYITTQDDTGRMFVLLANTREHILIHTPILDKNQKEFKFRKWTIKNARPTRDETGNPAISFHLDAQGAKYFSELTSLNTKKPMSILLDGVVYSSPVIQTRISDSGIISGKFSAAEASDLSRVLTAGKLPGSLHLVSESNFGPSIGAENLRKGEQAAKIGLIAVAVFMLFYYLTSGAIADVALVLNMIFIIGAMSLAGSVLTLPGIAGLILTIGMAVDANVLIFERLREEQAKGIAVKQAIRNAYGRAFTAIFDANLTTLLVCLFLYVVFGSIGMESVRGFSITLGLGVIFSMFTALVVTRWLYELLEKLGMLKKPVKMLSLIPNLKVNWIAKRKFFWGISAIMLVVGIASIIGQGSDIAGIEFSAGTNVTVQLKTDALVKDNSGKLVLPNDANMRAQFEQAVKDSNNDKLKSATVKKIFDAGNVQKLLKEFGDTAKKEITLAQWEAKNFNKKFFELLDTDKNKVLTFAELDEKLPDYTYEITTRENNLKVVKEAVNKAFAGKMRILQDCKAEILTGKSKNVKTAANILISQAGKISDGKVLPVANSGISVITENTPSIVSPDYQATFKKYVGGWYYLVNIPEDSRAISVVEMEKRINEERMLEKFSIVTSNKFEIIPLETSTQSGKFKSFAVLAKSLEENFNATNNIGELQKELIASSLKREQSLLLSNFDPEKAESTTWIAIVVVILSWTAIVAYLWLRFGSVQWGLAAVICLVHDVVIVVGMIAASAWISKTSVGAALGIGSFKIGLAMIAAILTVIGYSVNDSIVVFDRIRENRGKLKTVSVKCINDSINQTMPRTLLTSFTTFLVVAIMYIWGGQGIRSFNYALMVGIIFGTYSSIAIASPLLLGFKKALLSKTIADDSVAVVIDDDEDEN